jgi:hypothetical protein
LRGGTLAGFCRIGVEIPPVQLEVNKMVKDIDNKDEFIQIKQMIFIADFPIIKNVRGGSSGS